MAPARVELRIGNVTREEIEKLDRTVRNFPAPCRGSCTTKIRNDAEYVIIVESAALPDVQDLVNALTEVIAFERIMIVT